MKSLTRTACLVLFLSLIWSSMLYGQCTNEPDAPDCGCFSDAGAWDPSGPNIIDIALDTLNLAESCNCEANWCSPKIKNSGKPYYQTVVGCNSENCALFVSWARANFGSSIFRGRSEWCSESISYWHREAGIPFDGGYRTSWHLDWQVPSVPDLRTWYESAWTFSGRGNWIRFEDLDYTDPQLGLKIPVPGSYVATRGYDPGIPPEWSSYDYSHSLMIEEMWIHRDKLGAVFQIEVDLVEGNKGKAVVNNRHWDDLRELIPGGGEWVGTSAGPDGAYGTADDVKWKIYGFGVDFDSGGNPIYDPAKLHWEDHDFIAPPDPPQIKVDDPFWTPYNERVNDLLKYMPIIDPTGPTITSSIPGLILGPLPNGAGATWTFSPGLTTPFSIVIDLLGVHPIPVRGIEMAWGGILPGNFGVQYAGEDKKFYDATVPELSNYPQEATYPMSRPEILVPPTVRLLPAVFGQSGQGVPVRYVKLIFGKGSLADTLTLRELRFRYDTTEYDSEEIPPFHQVISIDVDKNGEADALTDGLLLLRYLFGFRGASLIEGAVGQNCQRCTAAEIEAYLQDLFKAWDIDANGGADALTDGLLALRGLFGFLGGSLVEGATASTCQRCDALEVSAYCQLLIQGY